MSFKRFWDKMKYIDILIRRKATGNQTTLAKKLNLSVSTINEYLKEMRSVGFPIKYCHKRKTYYYEKEGKMVDSLFEEEIDTDKLKKIRNEDVISKGNVSAV